TSSATATLATSSAASATRTAVVRMAGAREVALGRDALRGVADLVTQVRAEETLQRHDVRAQAVIVEVFALARPFISPQPHTMRSVDAAEVDLETRDADPLGLFGVTLRLLDHGDEAREHAIPPTSFGPAARER